MLKTKSQKNVYILIKTNHPIALLLKKVVLKINNVRSLTQLQKLVQGMRVVPHLSILI